MYIELIWFRKSNTETIDKISEISKLSISKDCLFVYTYHIGDNIKEPYNQFHFIKEISEIAPDLQTFIYTSIDNITYSDGKYWNIYTYHF